MIPREICVFVTLCVFCSALGCSSDEEQRDSGLFDAAQLAEGGTTNKAFGEECTANEQCASGVCHDFGVGSMCTEKCESPDTCPEGSEGKKCNKQGVCRP